MHCVEVLLYGCHVSVWCCPVVFKFGLLVVVGYVSVSILVPVQQAHYLRLKAGHLRM